MMTRLRPYCPQTPPLPADLLRGNPCDSRDPRSHVSLLKGLRETRASSVSYRAPSPYGETLSFEIKGTPSVTPTNVHCFTFSAKERDPETGLSYFGSRYYSSDLSIWLSVDPMAAKYDSLSPYCLTLKKVDTKVNKNGEYKKKNKRQTGNTFKP